MQRILWLSFKFSLIAALGVAVPAVAATNSAALVEAARRGDAAAVRVLLKGNADANSRSVDGTSPLHWAAEVGDVGTVKLLLGRGADPNAENRYGVTPLRVAARRGSGAIVEALLAAGATPDAMREESGETPLMVAARAGSVDVARALLAKGAKVDFVESKRRQTALMWAAAEGHAPVVKVLLEAGANPRLVSQTKISPLMFAIRAGDIESTRTLLGAGVDVNEPAADGTRMLHFAIINARFDLAKFLIERGADVKKEDPRGTPLQVLTFMRRAENIALATVLPRQLPQSGVDAFALATVLLKAGDDVNARYRNPTQPKHVPVGSYRLSLSGATPFFIAALTADVAWMRFLADNGADPKIPTLANITPLLAASGIGFWEGETPGSNAEAFEAVKLAAQLGNDPTYVVRGGEKPDPRWQGATALHGAATRGSEAMVIWLAGQGVPLDAKLAGGISAYHIATDNAGGMFHVAPEVAARLLALAKERGENVELAPPAVLPRRF